MSPQIITESSDKKMIIVDIIKGLTSIAILQKGDYRKEKQVKVEFNIDKLIDIGMLINDASGKDIINVDALKDMLDEEDNYE